MRARPRAGRLRKLRMKEASSLLEVACSTSWASLLKRRTEPMSAADPEAEAEPVRAVVYERYGDPDEWPATRGRGADTLRAIYLRALGLSRLIRAARALVSPERKRIRCRITASLDLEATAA